MLKPIGVFIVSSVLFLGIGLSVWAQEAYLPPEVTDIFCDAQKRCPADLECYSFPGVGLRCSDPNPCGYYQCPEDTQCVLLEMYPAALRCESLERPDVPPDIASQMVTKMVALDEDIQPEDLGVGEPRLLPDHPLYFLKNWSRGIQSVFAFSSVSKAELKMKFANEKLMEAKKIIEQNKSPEIIANAVNNYQDEIKKIKSEAGRIKEKAKESQKVDQFLGKFIYQQILHQKLLRKLESQVPEEAFDKIKGAREEHLESFEEVMLALEDRKEKITEKLTSALDDQKGSQFKHFKNLEILLELEEKVPEQAKDAIREAQENSLRKLQGDLEKMPPEDQERFKEYLGKISGEGEIHLEILENLKLEMQNMPETPKIIKLKEEIEEGKISILNAVREDLEESRRFPLCPRYVWLDPGTCVNGRIILEKDSQGCPLSPECIIPEEREVRSLPMPIPTPEIQGIQPFPGKRACMTLWDPVCGKDVKTYSNSCYAEILGVEVAYEGKCKIE